jgi:uncharacterized protein YfbU (UPF0304 family)
MKTLELTKDVCKLIADALESQIIMWEDRNRMIKIWELDDVVQNHINKNNVKIGELKTLLDYIQNDL